jgi:hypothetical protein
MNIRKAAAALGKLGGKSKSSAKRRASRENGKRGGRPKKKAGVWLYRPEEKDGTTEVLDQARAFEVHIAKPAPANTHAQD